MALKFGTSGVRGLVTDMTDLACYRYALAFAKMLKERTQTRKVCLAGDHRSSTPRIMAAVATAIRDEGLEVDACGYIPTPAVALHGMAQGAAAIMVTGSHIPEDRNGIKFYMPWGEILKADEEEISKTYGLLSSDSFVSAFDSDEMLEKPMTLGDVNSSAYACFVERYSKALPSDALAGLKLVCYQHSTVLREMMPEIFEALGAEVIKVGWSDRFVPVDTEAVDAPERLAAWVKEHGADALLSADGDGDRPLLVDDQGRVIRGDVLGILASKALQAKAVATPISCNTALEKTGDFGKIERTRIGSPFVIAGMQSLEKQGAEAIVGYEANGGYLTQSPLKLEGATFSALPTRDAVLPMLAVLLAAKKSSQSLSTLLAELPARVTGSGLLRGVEPPQSKAFLSQLQDGGAAKIETMFPQLGKVQSINALDGLRMTFESGNILHFRPSGNAPEFRSYAEANSEAEVQALVDGAMAMLSDFFAS